WLRLLALLAAMEWLAAGPRALQHKRAAGPMLRLRTVEDTLGEIPEPARAIVLAAVLVVPAEDVADLLERMVVAGRAWPRRRIVIVGVIHHAGGGVVEREFLPLGPFPQLASMTRAEVQIVGRRSREDDHLSILRGFSCG